MLTGIIAEWLDDIQEVPEPPVPVIGIKGPLLKADEKELLINRRFSLPRKLNANHKPPVQVMPIEPKKATKKGSDALTERIDSVIAVSTQPAKNAPTEVWDRWARLNNIQTGRVK
jgi:hypothetical protein